MNKFARKLALSIYALAITSCGARQTTVQPAAAVFILGERVLVLDSITESVSQRLSIYSREPDDTLSVRYRINEIALKEDGRPVLVPFSDGIQVRGGKQVPAGSLKVSLSGDDFLLWEFSAYQIEVLKKFPELCPAGEWRESTSSPEQVVFYICDDGSMHRFDNMDQIYPRIDLTESGFSRDAESGTWSFDRILARPGSQAVVVESGRDVFALEPGATKLTPFEVPAEYFAPDGAATPLIDWQAARQLYLIGQGTPEALAVHDASAGVAVYPLHDELASPRALLLKPRILSHPSAVLWFVPTISDPNRVQLISLDLRDGSWSSLNFP